METLHKFQGKEGWSAPLKRGSGLGSWGKSLAKATHKENYTKKRIEMCTGMVTLGCGGIRGTAGQNRMETNDGYLTLASSMNG